MDYGLYLSAAGVLTNMHRTDVHANNLANVATAGFKPDFAVMRHRLPERLEDNIADVPAHELLERLGGGVLIDPTRSDLTQGRLETSDQPLDLALQGDGFFVVDSGIGEGDERLRLSRDGRLTLDARGTLVRATDGLPMLDRNGAPIRLDRDLTVDVDESGAVRQGGAVVARLQVVSVGDDRLLEKQGSNTFAVRGGAATLRPSTAAVRQGMVEASGVDPIKAMLAIQKSTSAMNRNTRMIDIQNETVRGAITNLGRIA